MTTAQHDPHEDVPIESAMADFERTVLSVASGAGDRSVLASGLKRALLEAHAFEGQLADDSFATDDSALAWRQGALDAVADLRNALIEMLRVTGGEPFEGDALRAPLARTLEAERKVRDIHTYAGVYQTAVREALERALRVPCMRCAHRNPAGRSACEQCRFPLPSMGVERYDTDVIGGDAHPRSSAFLDRLESLVEAVEAGAPIDELLDFLVNLERLYVVGGRRLEMLMARLPRNHDAAGLTVELRSRTEGVRRMVEAVRGAVAGGDLESLENFRHWLADQFTILLDLNNRVEAACS